MKVREEGQEHAPISQAQAVKFDDVVRWMPMETKCGVGSLCKTVESRLSGDDVR